MLYDCAKLEERDRGITAAVEAVQRGDLVVLPTDTVFGIGGDAFKSWAVTALQNAKGRDRSMPVSVLVGSRNTLDGLVYGLPATARDLVEAFWPGGLTIIVEHATQPASGTSVRPTARSRCACRCTRWRWRCCARPGRWRCRARTRRATRRRRRRRRRATSSATR